MRVVHGRGIIIGLTLLISIVIAVAQQTPVAKTTGAEYLAQGDELMDVKDYNKALAKYMMAWLEMPDNAAVVHRVGNLYVASGRDIEASRFYAAAIRLNPGFEDPLLGLARIYLKVERLDQAELLLTDPVRLQAFARSGRYQHLLGLTYLRVAKYPQAIAALQEATRLVPEHGPYLGDLGNAYYLAKRYNDAVTAYDRALTLHPDDAIAALNRSMALEKLNRTAEAISSLELYLTSAKVPEEDAQQKRLVALKAKLTPSAASATTTGPTTP